MSAAINIIDNVPYFGGMFKVESSELDPVNAWPALIAMTSFVWFFIAAVLGITMPVMYPLPVVGVEMGLWSMGTLILGFTGIALVLTSMIFLYPIKILKMPFFEERHEDLQLAVRTLKDPGMVGMIMGVLVLLISGTPLMIKAGSLLLYLYGIFPASWIGWAADPVVFEFIFYIFAHNLMEAMAIMIIGAVYATLPLCLADGSRKLYSDKIALLALWILLLTSITSFFHHFYTMYPALPATFAYHGNIMSYATAIGAALTIFTILAIIWKSGLIASPAVFLILGGFVMYILDGAAAIVVSNVAWNFQLHGTLWVGGHAMVVLIAISSLWMGTLNYHFPLMTNRTIDDSTARSSIKYLFISYIGLFYTFMAAGADGVPRRNADWEGEWMIYAVLLIFFGCMMLYAFVLYALSLTRSKPIDF